MAYGLFVFFMIVLWLAMIAAVIVLCVVAYRCGKKSGNVTVSIVLIALGITSIHGLLHLMGTSRSESGMWLDRVNRERRELKNEKLRAEIEKLK
ncbi:MAG: hypothetical protein FWE45_05215 [Firmicutes bacterium]|nr:hypothetical protein [Bacillota bacterium]